MKKYIFMAVAGMLALSSCSNDDRDELNVQNAPQQMTFTAGYNDGATTRATLDGSTKKVTFDAGDKISILSVNNDNVTFTTSAGGATASFTGTATTGDAKYYAIYPQMGGLTLDSSTGVISGIVIPYEQDAAATSACGWDPSAAIAYATTTGTSLTFHNACALLKITNDVSDAEYIGVAANENMAGTCSIDTNTGTLTIQSGGNDYVLANGVQNGQTIYLAIAPGVYTDFRAFMLGSNSNDYSKSKTGSVTFEAGKIYDLGNTSDWDF